MNIVNKRRNCRNIKRNNNNIEIITNSDGGTFSNLMKHIQCGGTTPRQKLYPLPELIFRISEHAKKTGLDRAYKEKLRRLNER